MKSQVSVEVMILAAITILIFVAFLVSTTSLKQEFFGLKRNSEAKDLCEGIASEINMAIRAGDGYSRRFLIQDRFFGVSDFDISVNNYFVTIDWDENSVVCSIITKNITGNLEKGWNIIENINGSVYVSVE